MVSTDPLSKQFFGSGLPVTRRFESLSIPLGPALTSETSCERDIPTVKCGRGLNSLVLSSSVLVAVAELFVPVLDHMDLAGLRALR